MKYLLLLVLVAGLAHAQPAQIAYPVSEPVAISGKYVLYEPGATFLKISFYSAESPVTVSSPDGSESYSYPASSEPFVAISISGDTAVIEGTFVIESYDVGTDDLFRIESTCGIDDKKYVACYEQSEPRIYERAGPVARILMPGGSSCTAWRVGPGGLMLTNNHCVNQTSTIQGTEVWFNYEYDDCAGLGTLGPIVKIAAKEILSTYQPYDYTLFSLVNPELAAAFGWVGLDPRLALKGERIYITGHPESKPKKSVVESDLNASGYCEVDDPFKRGFIKHADFGYFCDSLGGQSGSPVFSYANHRALALHHFGGCRSDGSQLNSGVKLARIWPEIRGFFDGVPLNDYEQPVVQPLAVPTVECVDSTCTYDSAGSIGDVMWELGDGNISTAPSGEITFDVSAEYRFTLYASMNGVTDADAIDVYIDVPGYNWPPVSDFVWEDLGGRTVHLVSTAYDTDGEITQWYWRVYEDGVWYYYATPEVFHTFASGGEKYTDLKVWDNEGAVSTTYYTRYVIADEPTGPVCGNNVCEVGEDYLSCPADCPAPPPPPPPDIVLKVVAQKLKGPTFKATFSWTGAEGTSVTLRGSQTITTANDGAETLELHNREKDTAWRLCDGDSCSNTVWVTY